MTIEVFYSYSHKDEQLRDEMENHLATLKRQGVIKGWHDRQISAGNEWAGDIDEHLDSADVVLLLVSADFLASDYCYDVEVKRAMERHEAKEARVIPIILRSCDWTSAPFGKLQALPKNALPVTKWADRDEAFLDVAKGIRKAAEEMISTRTQTSTTPANTARVSLPSVIRRPPAIGFVKRRDQEGRDIVERLKEELAPQRNQLITLAGPGGVGKTTLAAEAARALTEVYRGRIVWSSAEARADLMLSTLLDDIATQLGRADLRTLAPDAKEIQVSALVADPPTLVVLDNYETITRDAQKRIEEWFVQAQCSVLITSRQRIGAALNIPVAAMSREEAAEFLERLVAQTQDPQIFSDEVRQRVYETAEANPFIMQWVVAQIDEAQEPRTVLEELTQGEGDAAQRVFDRSFNLPQLGDDGRAALLALSLFAPSATRDALAEVVGFGDDLKRVNEAVKNLRVLWLIKGIDGNRRLTIEGLTRSLAGARLSKDERATEFYQRFVSYFLSYTEAHARTTPEDFDGLEAEKSNLLGAIDVAFKMENWNGVMRIRSAVDSFLNLRGYWDEAIHSGQHAVKAAEKTNSVQSIGKFLFSLGLMFRNRGEYASAIYYYERAEEIARRLNFKRGLAGVLHDLGGILRVQGKIPEARQHFLESLELSREIGDQDAVAGNLVSLGTVERAENKLVEAQRYLLESLEIQRRVSGQDKIAITLNNLGMVVHSLGDVSEARRLQLESLEIVEKLHDEIGIASASHSLGLIAAAEGKKEEAVQWLRKSLNIYEKLKQPEAKTVRQALAIWETDIIQ